MILLKCIWCYFNEENWFIPTKIIDSEEDVTTQTFSWYGCKNENYCQVGVSKNNIAF